MNLQELIDFHVSGAESCEAYAITPGASEAKNKDIAKHYTKRAKWHRDAVELMKAGQHQGEPVALTNAQRRAADHKEQRAFNDWAFNKEGEAIGRMDGASAALVAWHARAKMAAQPAPEAVGDDQEFSLCWFEASQQWVVIFPSGKTLTGKFGSMGYAEGAAIEYLGLGEADFEVTEDNGSFYRYERDSEAEQ